MGKKRNSFTTASAAKCLAIGIIGSVLLVAAYILLELGWLSLIVNSEGLKNIFLGQMAVLIVIVPIMTGIAAAWSLSSLKIRFNGSVLAGLLAGITGGIGFFVALSTLILTWNMSKRGLLDWNTVHSTAFPYLTSGILGSFTEADGPVYLLLFILLSMMLSAIGAGIFFVASYYYRKGKRGKSKKPALNIPPYVIAILLAIIILPIAAAYAGMATGIVKNEAFVNAVDIQRTANDTIVFTNNGLDSVTDLDTGTPLIIYISDKGTASMLDMSDQQEAAKSQLNVTLTPASGFGISKGSGLTVKGPGIVNMGYTDNSTGKTAVHVMVIGTTVEGNEIILRQMSI